MSERKRLTIIYGTGNPAKLASMKRLEQYLDIEIIGLQDVKLPIPEIAEDGNTPLENARKKALGYYRAFHMPVFSCDSGMYIDEVTEEEQPGIHVRTVNGKYLTDEEMLEHYGGLAKKYGGLTARYRNAICLVMDEEHIYEAMDESMETEPFRMVDKPYPIRQKGFPLDSLSIDIKTGKYYNELESMAVDKDAILEGFRAFFEKVIASV